MLAGSMRDFSGYRYEPGTDLGGYQDFEYDPSDEAVNGPLGAAFNDYVRRELISKVTSLRVDRRRRALELWRRR